MTDIVPTLIRCAKSSATDWQNTLYGKAAAEIARLRSEVMDMHKTILALVIASGHHVSVSPVDLMDLNMFELIKQEIPGTNTIEFQAIRALDEKGR